VLVTKPTGDAVMGGFASTAAALRGRHPAGDRRRESRCGRRRGRNRTGRATDRGRRG
jgi:hypothetical protein